MPRETEEERAIRKEKERKERPKETEEERAARKEKERKSRPKETEEERAIRKEKERKEGRPKETEEERAIRKEKERKEGRSKETEEERAIRKEKERKERPKETEEERAIRKEKERKEGRPKETEEERAIRKEKERKEGRPKETEEERAIRKEKERKEGRPKETEEERRIRKDRERAERDDKEQKRAAQPVIRKDLPMAPAQQHAQSSSPHPVAEKPVLAAPPKPVLAAPPKNDADEDEDDGYGDDDFEEQLSPAEMAAIAAATEAENKEAARRKEQAQREQEMAASGSSPGRNKYDVDPSVKGSSRAGLDMNSLQRQKAKAQYEKDCARADALRRLVDLDGLTATVYDLPPQSEYDLFIRNFGGVVRQQTAVQAPAEEDMIDVEAQAERIHSKVKGCQCPEDLGLFPERKHVDPVAAAIPIDSHASPHRGDSKPDDEAKPVGSATRVDTVALGAFLARSFPVIRTLMDENEASRNPLTRRSSFSNHSFSSTILPLLYEPCAGRPVRDVTFSRFATQYLLVVYGPPRDGVEDTAAGLGAYNGVALLWNVNDNREPDKVLVSHSALTTACLSASRPYLAYAGTESGAVCVWDIREPEHIHADNSSTKGIAARLPSYATDWGKDNHTAPVVKCCISGYNSIMGVRKEEAEQLVSIDKKGSIFFWRVNDDDSNKKQTQNVISDSEYGLNLFSSVQLHRTASIDVAKGTHCSSSDLEFVPSDVSHLLVATSRQVEHVSKFGSITAPSAYKAQSQWGATTPASTVHYSPTDSRILVGGFRDGNVRLFLKDDPVPQVTVSIGSKDLSRVRCSTSMKWVVFALDSAGTLSVIDFAAVNKTTPVATSDLQEAKAGRCTTFDVSNEEKAETRLGIGYENGLVEVHTLNSKIFGQTNQRNERWL